MRKEANQSHAPTEGKIRKYKFSMAFYNAAFFAAFLVCLFVYVSSNKVSNDEQNIENISNIATAKSQLMLTAMENTSHEVKTASQYCTAKEEKEILSYLALVGDAENEYQLLTYDTALSTESIPVFSGHSTKKTDGAFRTVSYRDTTLARAILQHMDDAPGTISYSQSFTNQTDALRYFSVFCCIDGFSEGEPCRFFIVKPQKESKVLDQLQMYAEYAELATAVCYPDGKYLARENSFRADNFYDYLYHYNGLTIDERNRVRFSVQTNGNRVGSLQYKDWKQRDCLFAYASCGGPEKWYVIVSVPMSEFVSQNMLSVFPMSIIVFLTILLVFNISRLGAIIRELRMSVTREQVANSSKSLFLSRMSHEIRTPLNAVIGYNAIAKSSMTDAKTTAERWQAEMKVMDCLTKSEIASKHLLSIVNDVLDMSSIESGRMKVAHDRFDFRGLITSLTTVFYSQARAKGVSFDVVFCNLTEEWFIGDQMRTNQILTNLLSNAIKFTAEGGAVMLRIDQPEAETNASHIHFEISDSGIGMEESYLSHIWTPFEQEDVSISRRFGGTGLGLSITKNLVELMGGSITVDSKVGVGTTFFVDLTFDRTEQPLSTAAYDFRRVNALVVDDDSSTCDYIRLLFNRCGSRCATVLSGQDALKAISVAKEKNDPFTLCLIDWQMPQMDGIDTIRGIREIVGEEMPIIVLTAYDYSELAEKAAEVGVNQFIAKPLFQSKLFDLLATVNDTNFDEPMKKSDKYDFDGARVLLAEDNAMNMEIAKTIMESAGLVVDGVWNGKQAVERFLAEPEGTYTAILMDVHMPEMNGHDAAAAIRNSSHPRAKSIPIIAMTADAFAENVAEARASGMNAHIAKPIDIPTLFDTLKRFI